MRGVVDKGVVPRVRHVDLDHCPVFTDTVEFLHDSEKYAGLLPHVFKFWWFGIAKMTARRLVTATFLLTCLQAVLSFQHVPNSPCTDVCSGNPQNTLEKDVVCFDTDYTDNKDGEALRNCVACELNSTAVDTANNQSDVEWALCTRNKHPAMMDLY